MIVQSAPGSEPPLVIAQLEHTALSGRLAELWGNDRFAPLTPRALMLHVIAHHDQGWDEVDQVIGRDPDTGLPFNLVRTPVPELIRTGPRGADANEAFHPYCGLLASMHTHGLYHGRYGLSDKIVVELIDAEHQPAVRAMLEKEAQRRARLRASLEADPELAKWVAEPGLMHNYKLLQLFDTLALYFNCTREADRGTETFANVPQRVGEDVTVEVSRVAEGRYRVAPFPFRASGVQVSFEGRRLAAQPPGTSMSAALQSAPIHTEIITLVAEA